ncbi:MAG TPA: Flp pilus assembly protein CpaB [Actinomycetota bacterium]
MRRKLPRSSVALALAAVVVGVGTTVALRGRLAALEARADAAGDLRPAVVAAVDVTRGARIEPGHVETVEMPAALLPSTALTSERQAIGATLAGDVAEGEVLTETRVARAGPIAALVPEGFRAMGVTVAIAPGLLAPGDRVDVLAVAPGRPFAETLASGVEVLAVRETSPAEASVATVVLLVTPGQASQLAAGRAGAELALTVLPAGEVTLSG